MKLKSVEKINFYDSKTLIGSKRRTKGLIGSLKASARGCGMMYFSFPLLSISGLLIWNTKPKEKSQLNDLIGNETRNRSRCFSAFPFSSDLLSPVKTRESSENSFQFDVDTHISEVCDKRTELLHIGASFCLLFSLWTKIKTNWGEISRWCPLSKQVREIF